MLNVFRPVMLSKRLATPKNATAPPHFFWLTKAKTLAQFFRQLWPLCSQVTPSSYLFSNETHGSTTV